MIAADYKNFAGQKISFCSKNRTIPPTNTNLQRALGSDNVILLDEIRKIGQKRGIDTFLVGGAVRDTLISKKARDLDIMVNGDALEFSRIMREENPKLFKSIFLKKAVGRSVVWTDKMTLDIVPMSQDGHYSCGEHEIRKALRENAQHRDYTINSMFIRLGDDGTGRIKLKLIDGVGGKADLKKNVLRVTNKDNFRGNHVNSLRGIRLVKKYGMKREPETFESMKQCFAQGCKKDIVYIFRSIKEYARIFSLSKNPVDMYRTMKKYNVFKIFG